MIVKWIYLNGVESMYSKRFSWQSMSPWNGFLATYKSLSQSDCVYVLKFNSDSINFDELMLKFQQIRFQKCDKYLFTKCNDALRSSFVLVSVALDYPKGPVHDILLNSRNVSLELWMLDIFYHIHYSILSSGMNGLQLMAFFTMFLNLSGFFSLWECCSFA